MKIYWMSRILYVANTMYRTIEELVRIETMLQSQLSLNNPNIQLQVRLMLVAWPFCCITRKTCKTGKRWGWTDWWNGAQKWKPNWMLFSSNFGQVTAVHCAVQLSTKVHYVIFNNIFKWLTFHSGPAAVPLLWFVAPVELQFIWPNWNHFAANTKMIKCKLGCR